jgi:hypothetical protein
MTPEERIELAELHDLYDKHTPVWCDPAYGKFDNDLGCYCSACNMPLFKRGLVNSAGNAIWNVGIGLKDRKLMLSSDKPFAHMLKDMKDKQLAAEVLGALLLWHIRVQGMKNPPLYYATLAASIGADSPDFQRVVAGCGGWLAYDYMANFPEATDECKAAMRTAALSTGDPRLGYNMAIFIDKEPRQDTWDVVKTTTGDAFESYNRWRKYDRYKHITLV